MQVGGRFGWGRILQEPLNVLFKGFLCVITDFVSDLIALLTFSQAEAQDQ